MSPYLLLNLSKVMDDFTIILKEIMKHYNMSSKIQLTEKIHNDMLVHLMDRCLRVASHLIPPCASESAIKRADKHNIDLFKLREKDRNKVEANIKKLDIKDNEKFILEHYLPVNHIIKEIIAEKSPTLNTYENALKKLKVVWVLKSEDDKLNKNGHRKNRPNPEEAYQKAGIKILPNRYGQNWLN